MEVKTLDNSFRRQILVVEDDQPLRNEIRRHLENCGYEVFVAERGRQATSVITRQLPDLAIVDLYLPDISGFDVCRSIKRYADVPIILLTQDNTEENKIIALEQFAEDYLTKPIGLRELEARIGRILRRFKGPADESYPEIKIDELLHINFSQHWIEIRTKPDEEFTRYTLTPIESRILHILIRNSGRVMTTEALLARVWNGDDSGYPEGLRVHIRRLRMKIEQDPANPQYILTERGLGYRFGSTTNLQVSANATN